jgi:hypothetical protein
VHGLIFLFKWVSEPDDRAVVADGAGGPYFAKQVINNACATQALLNILLNCPGVQIGDELANFKSFTQDLPSDVSSEQRLIVLPIAMVCTVWHICMYVAIGCYGIYCIVWFVMGCFV